MPSPPVLLILFNREDTTSQVFDCIRLQRPERLFLAADGPRPGVETDVKACQRARAVVECVDWPCQVQRRFRSENLGCARGPADAITWFFENVEEGIILEDDCLPHPSFFQFAAEILEKYRDEPRIMHVSGNNFLRAQKRGRASYYFSKWTHNWGWATWRRAWQHFDLNLLPEPYRFHIWDGAWRLSVEKQGGLAVAPNVNLVTNIGCGHPSATHTHSDSPQYANLKSEPMIFPLMHPRRIRRMDRYTDYSVLRDDNTLYGLFVRPVLDLSRFLPETIKRPLKAVLKLFAP
jgi:hypothetical protein